MTRYDDLFGVQTVGGRCWISLPAAIADDGVATFIELDHDGAHYRDRAEAIAGGERDWEDGPATGPYTVAQLGRPCVQLRCTGCGYLHDEDGDTAYHLLDEADARASARDAGWTVDLVCTGCQAAALVDGATVTVTGTVVEALTVDLGAGVQAWALLDGPVLLDIDVAPAEYARCTPLLTPGTHITVTGTLSDRCGDRQRVAADYITVPAPAW